MPDESRNRRPRGRLEDVLLTRGSVTPEQLQQALAEQKKWGGELGRVVADLGFITEDVLMDAMAEHLGITRSHPADEELNREIVSLIGVQACERFGVIAIGGDPKKKVLRVATSDPTNEGELKALAATTKFRVEPAAATSDSIHRAIRKYYYGEVAAAPKESSLTGSHFGRAPPSPTPAATPRATTPSPVTATSPVNTPPPVASAPRAAAASSEVFLHLSERLLELEKVVRSQASRAPQIAKDPQFAALLARLEKLEQLVLNEANVIKTLSELIVERGIISRDELLARVRAKRAP